MKNRLITAALTILAIGAVSLPSLAREGVKHPRVAELEEHLRKLAQDNLKSRFPREPHTILVSVEPLFRYEPDEMSDDSSRGEDLPGLYVNKEEIRDEWDDPNTGLLQLLSRVRKIKVEIGLPDHLSDDDADEVKASILASLKLVSGRDTVEVNRKPWKGGELGLGSNIVTYGVIIVIMFLLGQSIMTFRNARLFAKALNPLQVLGNQMSGGGGGVTSVQVAAGSNSSKDAVGGGGGGAAQDVNMVDPVKLRDLIASKVDSLEGDSCFPILDDMLILDETGSRNPQRLSLIVEEFSAEVKNRVFSMGTSKPWWIDSFHSSSGQVDYEALMILQKLSRVKRRQEDQAWQKLLIAVWRMEDKISGFIRDVGEKRAIPILASFPKSIAVPAAKKAFPGSWGILLNPALPEDHLPEKEIEEVTTKALAYLPLREPTVLLSYRKERELISYLDRVDPKEEEEIYIALPESSNVSKIRPPFFRLFSQDKEVIRKVIRKLALEQIAQCAYSVDSSLRMKILEVLSEKQSFMVTEQVAKLEKAAPDAGTLADTKKKVGAILETTLFEIRQAAEQGGGGITADETTEEEAADEGGDDMQAAA